MSARWVVAAVAVASSCAAAPALSVKSVGRKRVTGSVVSAVLRVRRVARDMAKKSACAVAVAVAVGRDKAAGAVEVAASALS